MMPVMDGWDLRAEMIKDPALAAIPFVVLTGVGDAPADAAELQAAGCILKPFKVATILRFLEGA
jgi:CheY-like chemotaxis protein